MLPMRISPQNKVGVGFGLALLIMGVVGSVSYFSTRQQAESAAWVSHTHEILEDLEALVSSTKDIEIWSREFVIGGQEQSLKPYAAAVAAINRQIANLQALTADNPTQHQRLDVLRPLVVHLISEVNDVIDVRRRQGFDAVVAANRAAQG